MKNVAHQSDKHADPSPSSPATEALHKKAAAAEKSVQNAWADYENQDAAYADALKNPVDKAALLMLRAAAKIAKLTYKIRRTEYKLAKAQWKASAKSDKKSAEKPGKSAKPAVQKKANHKAPKDTAAKSKSSAPAASAKADKKKAAPAQA